MVENEELTMEEAVRIMEEEGIEFEKYMTETQVKAVALRLRGRSYEDIISMVQLHGKL